MAAAAVHVMNLPPDAYQAHAQPMMSHLNVGPFYTLSQTAREAWF
jgi:hypothetical protein